MSTVQSILFDRHSWTPALSSRWLIDHGFKATKIDITENKYRFRQKPPIKGYNYRIKRLPNGIEFIIMFRKKMP